MDTLFTESRIHALYLFFELANDAKKEHGLMKKEMKQADNVNQMAFQKLIFLKMTKTQYST